MTLCIIGGDERMKLLPQFLAEKCLAAQPQETSRDELYSYLEILLARSDAVILPIPMTRDGMALNAPHFSAKAELTKLLDMCKARNLPVLGGCVDDDLLRRYGNIYDYAATERFAARNARLTAEGTLSTMIAKSRDTLYGSKVLFIGGGRIANALLPIIIPFTDDITIAARRDEIRRQFEKTGAKAVDTADLSLCGYDYIINTVPYSLISESVLSTAKPNAIMFDLATKPCGIDFEAAKRLNIAAYSLPGVPGKCSPIAAARVIADEIETILKGIDLV